MPSLLKTFTAKHCDVDSLSIKAVADWMLVLMKAPVVGDGTPPEHRGEAEGAANQHRESCDNAVCVAVPDQARQHRQRRGRRQQVGDQKQLDDVVALQREAIQSWQVS